MSDIHQELKSGLDKLRAEASRGSVSSSRVFSLTDPLMDLLARNPPEIQREDDGQTPRGYEHRILEGTFVTPAEYDSFDLKRRENYQAVYSREIQREAVTDAREICEFIQLRILALSDGTRSAKKDFAIEELRFVLSRLEAASLSRPSPGVVKLERPLTPLPPANDAPEWKQINDMFHRHRLEPPTWQLRDKLVNLLVWARYGEKLDAALSPSGEEKP